MAKKKQEEVKKGLDEWMGTFSDMMTLLMCFFVMLFSMSTIDAAKFSTSSHDKSSKESAILSALFSPIPGNLRK